MSHGSHPILTSAVKLLKRLILPAPDEQWAKARMGVRADLAWQPYLFLALFYGTVISVTAGGDVDPPGMDFELTEWLWASSGIGAPILGFIAVWMIVNTTGRCRYRGLWIRLSAGVLAVTTMTAFLYEHIAIHAEHPFEGAIVVASILFVALLVWRDARFLLVTERLARKLQGGEPT